MRELDNNWQFDGWLFDSFHKKTITMVKNQYPAGISNQN
jgi:hypothetical protein